MRENPFERHYPLLVILAFLTLLLVPLRTFALDPAGFEENFYGRRDLVAWASNLRIWIGDRVFPKVLVGEDGWLVYTAEHDIDGYQRANPFTAGELARIQQSLDALSARYAARGTTLLVVVPPNKNTIYPERVPREIPVLDGDSALEQLVVYLRENGKTQILDLRPALLAAKAEQEIYYATDTHWNDYGVYIAYQQIMSSLQANFPGLPVHPRSDFKVVRRQPEQLDLAKNIGATLFPEQKVQFAIQFDTRTAYKTVNVGGRKIQFSYNPDSSLPSAVVYHDSFFFRIIPLLGESLSHGIFVQNYMGGGLWSLSWVEEYDPDIVIIEFSERYIHDLPILIDPD